MTAIATVSGTAILPGLSRNKRLYTPEVIGKMVARAQERLASEDGMPLTMMVAHPEPDKAAYVPVTKIVGRVTEMWQEPDGRAKFRAEVVDTAEGADVLKLVDRRTGKPVLKGVSIRGGWIGRTRRVVLPGGDVGETGDDLELDGLDYTHRPGVVGAEIEDVALAGTQARESGPDGRTPITESVQEALVETIEEAAPPAAQAAPSGEVVYADPGYQADKKKRYPLDTKAHAKATWLHLNESDNAKAYTAAQLKRIRQRTVKGLKKFGVDVAVKEGWLIDRVGQVTESALVTEYWDVDPSKPGSFCINLANGPLSVSISSCSIDPHDLDAIGRAAMAAACQALAAIDPDLDGDMDVPGAPAEDTDGDLGAPRVESAEDEDEPDATESAPTETPQTPRPDAGGTPTQKEAVVSDETTTPAVEAAAPQAAAPATITLTEDMFKELLAAVTRPAAPAAAPVAVAVPAPVAAPVESAPAAPVTEAAPAAPAAAPAAEVTETEDQRIARIVEAQVAQRMAGFTQTVQETVVRQGPPTRKGLVGRVTESGELATTGAGDGTLNDHGLPSHWPNKPLHQYTAEERAETMSAALVEHVVGKRIA